jgi:amidase
MQLQEQMDSGRLTSRSIVEWYLEHIESIDSNGPRLNSVMEMNPDAITIADTLDAERAEKGPRGPMHGIPVLLKDNIDTAEEMMTTAGSSALLGSIPARDAFVFL